MLSCQCTKIIPNIRVRVELLYIHYVQNHLKMMHALQMRPRAPAKLSSPAAARSRLSTNSFVVRAAKVADGPKIAIVGVTGAVGQEFLRVRCVFVIFRTSSMCQTLNDGLVISASRKTII